MIKGDEQQATGKRAGLALSSGHFAGAVALLLVIAAASMSASETETLEPTLAGFLVLAIAGAVSVAIAGTGLLLSGQAIFGHTRLRTKLLVVAVVALLVVALVAATLIGSERDPSPAPEGLTPTGGMGTTRELEQTSGTYDWAEPVAAGALLAALLILAAAIVGAEVRRRTRTRAAPMTEAEAVMLAVDESLEDLRRERDVRRAIIACYARMERALERVGSGRRPSEAPLEYLARILERLAAGASAAGALTELFERAKFSVEAMGEREKRKAIGALELLRTEMSAQV